VREIVERSQAEALATNVVADQMVDQRLAAAGG
jgi:hypothetical protein